MYVNKKIKNPGTDPRFFRVVFELITSIFKLEIFERVIMNQEPYNENLAFNGTS